MAQGLAQSASTGAVIEAKFELDDEGNLSLSTYPIGAPIENDSERSKFQELAGDPTVSPWKPALEPFHDLEHLTRSSRGLTLVQTAKLSLRDAVAKADAKFPGGFVYWAIPTRRGTQSGYGIYI